jgi:hypothetical protein
MHQPRPPLHLGFASNAGGQSQTGFLLSGPAPSCHNEGMDLTAELQRIYDSRINITIVGQVT